MRDGTLSHTDFGDLVVEIRSSIKAILKEADSYLISGKEQTPLAKTVRTCCQLLKVEPGMWLFVSTQGVEPTNNAAERAIRPAVFGDGPVLALKPLRGVCVTNANCCNYT